MKILLVLFLTFSVTTFAKDGVRQSDFDTITLRTPPGLKAPKKLWWLKEITPDFHMAGRLTDRQIKYIADGGFKSIISLFTDKEAGRFGGEHLPTSEEAEK